MIRVSPGALKPFASKDIWRDARCRRDHAAIPSISIFFERPLDREAIKAAFPFTTRSTTPRGHDNTRQGC
jgi:hypothetical protein